MSAADIRFVMFGLSCFVLGIMVGHRVITFAHLKEMELRGKEAYYVGMKKAFEEVKRELEAHPDLSDEEIIKSIGENMKKEDQ